MPSIEGKFWQEKASFELFFQKSACQRMKRVTPKRKELEREIGVEDIALRHP
jgi:hypothetical protein